MLAYREDYRGSAAECGSEADETATRAGESKVEADTTVAR